jgi:hypothetical protein
MHRELSMKRVRAIGALIGVVLIGCNLPEVKVVEELPDPVVSEQRVVRRTPSAPPPRYEPPARDAGEPEWLPPSGISSRWTAIVIHHSVSDSANAATIDAFHRNSKGWDELGYHFVIGTGSKSGDGEVEVGPRWRKQKHGAHAKTPDNYYNEHGIGICLVGNFQEYGPTPAQLRSLERLVRFLMNRTHISPSALFGHREVKATECPGRHFPLASFRGRMALAGLGDRNRIGIYNSSNDNMLHHEPICDCGSEVFELPRFGPAEITGPAPVADKNGAKCASAIGPIGRM